MKERPIIFSGDSVRAILAGNKTQTRRVLRVQPSDTMQPEFRGLAHHVKGALWRSGPPERSLCPYGVPGERLWVKETFRDPDTLEYFCYKASSADFPPFLDADSMKWTSPIFMRRSDSRITLEIADVQVQRVQDISDKDCLAEGMQPDETESPVPNYVARFQYHWDSINAKRGYSWESNPWVWAITFRTI